MSSLETLGFKVRSYEIIGKQPAAGVQPKDTLRTKSIEAQLQQGENLSVNVSDFDPDGSTFLGSHKWEKLGFFMSITSVGKEFTDEAIYKGYDPAEVLRDIVPELGRFSVLTVAQPIYSLAPGMEDKLGINPDALEHFKSLRLPYLFATLNNKGEKRVCVETQVGDQASDIAPVIFHKNRNGMDILPSHYAERPENTISALDYENLREVHDLLEQQAIDHVVEAAKIPTAAA